jgi:ATP phosphoribosyltransferase regulatory subunit
MTWTSAAPDGRADALITSFERAGYVRVTPAILQPAEPFLDLSGEDIRKRMYLTTDPQGRELCLRPDLTIPVSRDYLASPAAGAPQALCYLGPVFRHRAEGAAEFLQAGIESFGRPDKGSRPRRITAWAAPTSAWATSPCFPP